MTGLEVRAARRQRADRVTAVALLLGMTLVEGQGSAAVFTVPAHGWLCAPEARVYGRRDGILRARRDAVAVHTTLPKGAAFATLDLTVNFLRPIRADGRCRCGFWRIRATMDGDAARAHHRPDPRCRGRDGVPDHLTSSAPTWWRRPRRGSGPKAPAGRLRPGVGRAGGTAACLCEGLARPFGALGLWERTRQPRAERRRSLKVAGQRLVG